MARTFGRTLLVAALPALLSAAAQAADVKDIFNACQTFRDSVFQGCGAGCTGAARARCLNGCSKHANDEFNSCLKANGATGGR